MKIETTKPPKHIWDKAHELFRLDDHRVVYTYGDTLHNPGGCHVDASLEAHESIHTKQQEAAGGPDKWWELYFSDPNFRRDQEIEAYKAQYRHMCIFAKDRNYRAKYLWEIAQHLSSKMYGAGISHSEAMKAIRS